MFGVEDPGYPLIARLYGQNGARVVPLPLDAAGVTPDALETAGVNILHISPNHHFPTGIVMPVGRRQELLAWLAGAPDRYIIEDDYDSEFRMEGRPIPSLQSMDGTGRVIYVNTFSKTVAPSLRIGYAVLPPDVSRAYRERLGFLSCPVSVPEQYILAAFMTDGSLARHISRMRTRCRGVRDALLAALGRLLRWQNAIPCLRQTADCTSFCICARLCRILHCARHWRSGGFGCAPCATTMPFLLRRIRIRWSSATPDCPQTACRNWCAGWILYKLRRAGFVHIVPVSAHGLVCCRRRD